MHSRAKFQYSVGKFLRVHQLHHNYTKCVYQITSWSCPVSADGNVRLTTAAVFSPFSLISLASGGCETVLEDCEYVVGKLDEDGSGWGWHVHATGKDGVAIFDRKK